TDRVSFRTRQTCRTLGADSWGAASIHETASRLNCRTNVPGPAIGKPGIEWEKCGDRVTARSISAGKAAHGELDDVARTLAPALDRCPVGLARPLPVIFPRLAAGFLARQHEGLAHESVARQAY